MGEVIQLDSMVCNGINSLLQDEQSGAPFLHIMLVPGQVPILKSVKIRKTGWVFLRVWNQDQVQDWKPMF